MCVQARVDRRQLFADVDGTVQVLQYRLMQRANIGGIVSSSCVHTAIVAQKSLSGYVESGSKHDFGQHAAMRQLRR